MMRPAIVAVVAFLLIGAVPATRPTTPTSPRITLRDGAPPAIQAWFAKLPQLRQDEMRRLQTETRAAITKLQSDISQEERAIQEAVHRETHPIVTHGAGGTSSQSNGAEETRITIDIQEHRKAKGNLLREVKKVEADGKTAVEAIRNNPSFFAIPPLSAEVGSIGKLDSYRVFQVVDDRNFIAKSGPDLFIWISGVDTKSMVDDMVIINDQTMMVTGTKRYQTALAGSKTVFMVEPCRILDWVNLNDGFDRPSKNTLPPERAEKIGKGISQSRVTQIMGVEPKSIHSNGEVTTCTWEAREGAYQRRLTITFRQDKAERIDDQRDQ